MGVENSRDGNLAVKCVGGGGATAALSGGACQDEGDGGGIGDHIPHSFSLHSSAYNSVSFAHSRRPSDHLSVCLSVVVVVIVVVYYSVKMNDGGGPE